MTRTMPSLPDGRAELYSAVDRWLREGLISPEQAARLRVDLATHDVTASVPQPRTDSSAVPAKPAVPESLLTEALSYLGGVLVLVAGGLLTARLWDDLAYGGRVLLAMTVTLVLLGGGVLVPAVAGPAGRRVRSVLWVLSVAALTGLLGIVAADGLGLEGPATGMLIAGGAAVYSAGLYWRLRAVPQQLALFAACLGFVAAAGAQLDQDGHGILPGIALLALAALWAAAADRGLLTPPRAALAASAVGGVIGAVVVSVEGHAWTQLLALAVIALIVAVAVRRSDVLLLGIGTVGALQLLPRAVTYFFPGEVAAAVTLLLAGMGLIAAGIGIARRRAKAQHAVG